MFFYKKKLLLIVITLTLPLGLFAQADNSAKPKVENTLDCRMLTDISNSLYNNPKYLNPDNTLNPAKIEAIRAPEIREAARIIALIKLISPSFHLGNFNLIRAIEVLSIFLTEASLPKNNSIAIVLKDVIKKLINCLNPHQIHFIINHNNIFESILTNFDILDLILAKLDNLNLEQLELNDIRNLLLNDLNVPEDSIPRLLNGDLNLLEQVIRRTLLFKMLSQIISHQFAYGKTKLLRHFIDNHYLYKILDISDPQAEEGVVKPIFGRFNDAIDQELDAQNTLMENNPESYENLEAYQVSKDKLKILLDLKEIIKQEVLKSKELLKSKS